MTRLLCTRLLCIGDVNLDVTITLAGSLAEGLVTGSDTRGTVESFGGGSAANVAAWAADRGAPTRFVGVVGNDVAGAFLVDDLRRRGVEVRMIERLGATTRSIAVVVDDRGERSMVSDLDTAMALDPGDLRTDWFDGVDWLHLTAYTFFAERSRQLFVDLIRQATERSVPFSVDPSALGLLRSHGSPSELGSAFTGASVLFPNLDEATYLTGESDPVAAAEGLLTLAEVVALTNGAEGAHIARRGAATLHVPATPSSLVNTLGCGDAFAGGFLAARLTGADDHACGIEGAQSAARALELPSAR